MRYGMTVDEELCVICNRCVSSLRSPEWIAGTAANGSLPDRCQPLTSVPLPIHGARRAARVDQGRLGFGP